MCCAVAAALLLNTLQTEDNSSDNYSKHKPSHGLWCRAEIKLYSGQPRRRRELAYPWADQSVLSTVLQPWPQGKSVSVVAVLLRVLLHGTHSPVLSVPPPNDPDCPRHFYIPAPWLDETVIFPMGHHASPIAVTDLRANCILHPTLNLCVIFW